MTDRSNEGETWMMSNTASSCECTKSSEPLAEAIVCSLAGRDQHEQRAAEFRDAFTQLRNTESFEGGFRWYFHADAELEMRLRGLAQREHECCKFFDFQIHLEENVIVWETRAAKDAGAVLEAFKLLPETLARAARPDALTHALSEAGLTFAADLEGNDRRR
jgi:hypothetical protein